MRGEQDSARLERNVSSTLKDAEGRRVTKKKSFGDGDDSVWCVRRAVAFDRAYC